MSTSIIPSPHANAQPPRISRWRTAAMKWLLTRVRYGTLVIHDATGEHHYGRGEPRIDITVSDPRVYGALLTGGSIAFGESYVDGWWDVEDLTSCVQWVMRNVDPVLRRIDRLARSVSPLTRVGRWLARARPAKDRQNIRAHYDIGNDLYRLMLDETMMYSCAYFATPETTLYEASVAKLDKLCRKLDLRRDDHLVEIGSGWGGLAIYAAATYGCRVTSVTISDAQYIESTRRVRESGLEHLVTIKNQDYRELEGTFDKLVSVEMVEAIGWRQLDTYFATLARLVKPEGLIAIQAITIDDRSFERTKNKDDFIKRLIFPGGFLPSVESLVRSATAVSDLRLVDLEDIGRHYAETLRRWRQNLAAHADAYAALDYGPRFARLWHMYLCYCEAAFLERHVSDVQVVFAREDWRGVLGPSALRA